MKKIQIEKLEGEEKYRLMRDCFWTFSTTIAFNFAQNFGIEKAFEIFPKGTNAMAEKMGEKLTKKFNLKENIEDVLKLLSLYYNEIWGSEDGYAMLKSETEGLYIVQSCTWYDKFFSLAKIPCDKSCEPECKSLIKPLSSDFQIKIAKAKPRGDSVCEFQIVLVKKG